MKETALRDLSEKTVLYLEDEILIGLDGELILEDIGFGTVLLCHTLETAHIHLENRHIDFALLDINLGDGRTSLSFAKSLREKGVPIAFASGYNRSEDLTCDFSAPVVVKPFSNVTIRNAVMLALSNHDAGRGAGAGGAGDDA